MLKSYEDQNKTRSSILDVVVVVVVVDTTDVAAEDEVNVDDVVEEGEEGEEATRDDEEGKTAVTAATAARRKSVDSIPAHTHFARKMRSIERSSVVVFLARVVWNQRSNIMARCCGCK